jgi:hypothetical protein
VCLSIGFVGAQSATAQEPGNRLQVVLSPLVLDLQGVRSGGPAPVASPQAAIDPMGGPLVTGAPFSADALTTVTQTLGDGTRLEQRVTAKFYRDTAGRVRREQTIIGLDALAPGTPSRTMITLDSVAADPMPYVIDPVARTARRMPRGSFAANSWSSGVTYFGNADLSARRITRQAAGDQSDANQRELERAVSQLALNLNQMRSGVGQNWTAAPIPPDVRPTEEELGTRQMEGVKATGRRITAVIPIDRVGNDRPITITDERWESPELKLVVYSRFADPRTGVVEYRLTGINRGEPRAELFTVPSDFTVVPGISVRPVSAAPAGGGGRGQRGGAPQQ